jgi:hypothetical protein
MIVSVTPKRRKEPQFPGLSVRNAANAAKVSMNLVERRCQSIARECQLANALKGYKGQKYPLKLREVIQPKSLRRSNTRRSGRTKAVRSLQTILLRTILWTLSALTSATFLSPHSLFYCGACPSCVLNIWPSVNGIRGIPTSDRVFLVMAETVSLLGEFSERQWSA